MKSNFLKLGSMLLCGAMFATVACTDFSEDMNQMAGDVDALEVTLGDLQEELDALKGAQDALEDLVALKADAKDLEKAVADLKGDVKKVSDALANYATVDQLNKAVADATAQVTEVVAGLQSQIDALKAASDTHATKDELKKVSDDLVAAKADLQKSIADVETAAKAYTDALANGAVKENTDAIAKLDEAVKALQGDVKTLDGTVKELGERITKAENAIKTLEETTIPALEKAIKDVEDDLANYVTKDALNEQLKNYASAATVKAVQDALAAAQAELLTVQNLFNALATELQYTIQSLVFVPEYDDLKITGYRYTFDGTPVSRNVVVKGTFKVTPAQLAEKIGNEYAASMCAKNVKDAATRAGANELWTKAVVSNVAADGTFDVEAVFSMPETGTDAAFSSAADFLANAVVALYVNESGAVAEPADDVEDGGMGVGGAALDILKNDVSSAYVGVAYAGNTDLATLYALYNKELKVEYKDVPAEKKNVTVAWDATENAFSPLAGFEPCIKIAGEYMTIAEAAEFMHVDVEAITPDYEDVITYDNDPDLDECTAITVTEGKNVLNRTIAISKPVTVAKAGDFVNHNVVVEGEYSVAGVPVIEDVDYSYTIGNRKISLNLEDVTINWTYELAKTLSTSLDANGAYRHNLSATSYEPLKEVSVNVEGTLPGDYNIKQILAGGATETWYKVGDAAAVKDAYLGHFVVNVTAYQDAQIAEVIVRPRYYAKNWGKTVALKNVYNIAADYTDIDVNFALTLGALPAAKTASYEFTLPLTSNGTSKKNNLKVEDKLWAAGVGFADKAEFKSALFESNTDVAAGTFAYVYPKGVVANKRQPNDANTKLVVDGLAPNSQYVQINTIADLVNANDTFEFQKQFTTWFGTTYTVNVKADIAIPTYDLTTVPAWVTDNVVNVPGHTDASGHYVVDAANLHTYFHVEAGDDADVDNDNVAIKWEVVTTRNLAKGIDNLPSAPASSAVDVEDNTIAPAVIEWNQNGEYTALDLQVKATLVMLYGSSSVALDEPIVITLSTKSMINVKTADETVIDRNGYPEVTATFFDGLTITGNDASANSFDYEVVDGVRKQRNFIAETWTVEPLYTVAKTKYCLEVELDPTTIKTYIDGQEYPLSTDNYVLDANFAQNGKITFKSNDATLEKPVTFTVEGTVSYDRDYMGKDQAKAKTDVVLSLTFADVE